MAIKKSIITSINYYRTARLSVNFQHVNTYRMKYFFIFSFAFLTFQHSKAQFIVNNGISLSNTGLLVTNGDWQNQGTFVNSGTITTSESWTHTTGTLTSPGGFELNYNAIKAFSPGSNLSLGFLKKSGDAPARIFYSLDVRDSLYLLKGALIMEPATKISIAATCFVKQQNASHVQGAVARAGIGKVTFPIGLDGFSMPVLLLNVQGANPITELIVEPAPAGVSKGPGVKDLIGFPYAWRITANAGTSNNGVIEVQYPTTLPISTSPVLTKADAGQNLYESWGASVVENSSGVLRLQSYTNGTNGVFSIGEGFAGNLDSDKAALTLLYTKTDGPSWTKNSKWLGPVITDWQGVTVTGGRVTGLVLPDANIKGEMPDEMITVSALRTLNLSNNFITKIPKLTPLLGLSSVNFANNLLTFASLENNVPLGPVLDYTNQKLIDLLLGDSVLIKAGDNYTFIGAVGGNQNSYTFKRNDVDVTSNIDGKITLNALGRANMGVYTVSITSPLVPNLTLNTKPVAILAVANISGRLLASANTPVTEGAMNLFRITATGAYDTTQIVSTQNDGSYLFEKVVLDDYLVLGKPNKDIYPSVVPTYFNNTIFWEEANPQVLNSDIENVDIIAQFIPSNVPQGDGSISGFLEEDDPSGRVEKTKRVGGSGVSVRRKEGTGRGEETRYELIGYTETDEEGEFLLDKLPTGEYRFNIQYPGYPIDETAFLDFNITTNPLEKDLRVEATVTSNKIRVRELLITSVEETFDFQCQVYPNPTSEIITISFPSASSERNLVVRDLSGKVVKQQLAKEKNEVMAMTDVPVGIYLLQILEKDKIKKIYKLVIKE
jgi:hypothetical protein